jgi:hypothetical protein
MNWFSGTNGDKSRVKGLLMYYFKNINFVVSTILVVIFSVYKVNAQSSPIPTPTNFIPRAHKYPTPDWGRLKSGRDYKPNFCEVSFKKGISLSEKERVLKKMKTIGKITDCNFPALNVEFYMIKITNGMSEKEAIDFLNADPAVEGTSLAALGHLD